MKALFNRSTIYIAPNPRALKGGFANATHYDCRCLFKIDIYFFFFFYVNLCSAICLSLDHLAPSSRECKLGCEHDT